MAMLVLCPAGWAEHKHRGRKVAGEVLAGPSSELAREASAERAAVGVVEEAVDRRRPEAGQQREPLGPVRAQPAGRAGTAAAALVPRLQRSGARVQRRDEAL